MKGLRTGDQEMDERVKIDFPLEGLDVGPIPDDELIAGESLEGE